jgi:origin recognition complex subunit 1
VCRRGCNTRTATYTDEFIWENIYQGSEGDIFAVIEMVKALAKAPRTRETDRRGFADDRDFVLDADGYGAKSTRKTPTKPTGTAKSRKNQSLSTPSHRYTS